jgi:hypothetical protein
MTYVGSLPIATRIEGERVSQLVRGDAKRQGLQAALFDEPVRPVHHRLDDVLAQVVPRASGAGGRQEHRIVWPGLLARCLVLGQDLAQQREHVDLPHPCVCLVAADLEPPVGEVDVAPQHGPGCRRSSAAEEQRGEGRAPAGRLERRALGPGLAMAILDFDLLSPRSRSPAASSRIAICSALSR